MKCSSFLQKSSPLSQGKSKPFQEAAPTGGLFDSGPKINVATLAKTQGPLSLVKPLSLCLSWEARGLMIAECRFTPVGDPV
jgi:hypothetical protein